MGNHHFRKAHRVHRALLSWPLQTTSTDERRRRSATGNETDVGGGGGRRAGGESTACLPAAAGTGLRHFGGEAGRTGVKLWRMKTTTRRTSSLFRTPSHGAMAVP